MKFRKLIAGILGFVLAIIFITVSFSTWQIANKSAEYKSSRIFNYAQQLNLAIQTYVSDSFNSGGLVQYPKSLHDLTKGNYLTESDLRRLTSDFSPIYHPPESGQATSESILSLTSDIYTVTCSADGKISVTKNK